MVKHTEQNVAYREALAKLERLFRREVKLSMAFAGLIFAFLTLGTMRALGNPAAGSLNAGTKSSIAYAK